MAFFGTNLKGALCNC